MNRHLLFILRNIGIIILFICILGSCGFQQFDKGVPEYKDLEYFLEDLLFILIDFVSMTLLSFSILTLLALLIKKDRKDQIDLAKGSAILLAFIIFFYILTFGESFFSGELFITYFNFLKSFQKPLYSILIIIGIGAGFTLSILISFFNNAFANKRRQREKEINETKNKEKTTSLKSETRKISKKDRYNANEYPGFFESYMKLFDKARKRFQKQRIIFSSGEKCTIKTAYTKKTYVPVFTDGSVMNYDTTMYYVVCKTNKRNTALKFLISLPLKLEPFQYIIVETPEGNIGKDIDGIYEE